MECIEVDDSIGNKNNAMNSVLGQISQNQADLESLNWLKITLGQHGHNCKSI